MAVCAVALVMRFWCCVALSAIHQTSVVKRIYRPGDRRLVAQGAYAIIMSFWCAVAILALSITKVGERINIPILDIIMAKLAISIVMIFRGFNFVARNTICNH